MATIGNAPVFPTESVLPGNLEVTGNATISGSSATVNGDEVRTVGTSGAILQVVQATTNTTVSITTSTYTDTTLSASITPTSSSNKILVIVGQHFQNGRTGGHQGFGLRILRDSTVVWEPVNDSTGPFLVYTVDESQHYGFMTLHYLDSPATTSSVTYKTQGRPYYNSSASSGFLNFQSTGSGGTVSNTDSLITLMEVVA